MAGKEVGLMTVGEAIERLSKFPPDTLFGRADYEWCGIRAVTEIDITAVSRRHPKEPTSLTEVSEWDPMFDYEEDYPNGIIEVVSVY